MAPDKAKARRINLLVCLAPLILTGVIYAPVAGHGYIDFDDPLYTYDNGHVASGLTWSNIVWAWTRAHAANFHPLTWMSHMADFALFDGDPGWSAVENAALHGLNACLVTALLLRLFGARALALLGGAVFAAHPVLVEAVAWISQRKTVLSSLFALVAIHAYLSAGRTGSTRLARRSWWAVSIVAHACSLCAKGMFVTLPLVLLLLVWLRQTQGERNPGAPILPGIRYLVGGLASVWPHLALSAACAAATLWAQAQGGAVATLGAFGPVERIAVAANGVTQYLWQFLCPRELSVYYPLPSWTRIDLALDLAALLAVTAAAGWAARKVGSGVMIGWILFLVFLLPVVGLVQVGSQAHADRYLYPSLLGLLIALGALWQSSGPPALALRRVLAGAALAWVAFLAALAHTQVGAWRDSVTLAVRSMESVGRVPELLTLQARGLAGTNPGEAVRLAREAYALAPGHPTARQNLTMMELMAGNDAEAWRLAQLDVAERPESTSALFNFALIGARQGEWERVRWALAEIERLEKVSLRLTARQRGLLDQVRAQIPAVGAGA